jgi:polygalacturonase
MRTSSLPAIGLILCLAAGSACGATLFNIVDYGARGDGSTPATDAIRQAIQAAHAAGGGTVFIPAGQYVSGPIELVSNLVLNIEAGATLRFPAARLPYTKGRTQGIETIGPVPLIGGHDLENVTITGRGVIATDNAEWVKLMGGPTPRSDAGPGSAFGPDWNQMLADLQKQTPRPEAEYLKIAPFLRPSFIRLTESRNIVIEGIHMIGAPFWSVHMLYSQNIAIRNVTLETFPGAFTGGIYIDSSRDVRISDSYLDNGDDAITLKAGKDADGLRVNRPTENVTISNIVVHRGSGCVVMGSETSGGIRNVVVSNVVCQGTQGGINIKSERGRGGSVEDVRFDNIEMDEVGRAINVSQYYQMQGETPAPEEPVSRRTPVFRNITISHVTISRARGVSDYGWNPDSISSADRNRAPQPITINIDGLPEMPISGLRIMDVVSTSAGGLRARHTAGLELHNVQMNTQGVPAFLIKDSRDLELDGISSRNTGAGMPVLRLDNCPGAVVRNSHAFSGTGTFLSAGPGELKTIQLMDNALRQAGKASEESAVDFWRDR